MTLRFDQPVLLWLALLAIPVVFAGWRSLAAFDSLRRWTVVILRVVVIVVLAVLLAGPNLKREHHGVSVIGLLDVSGSVRRFADLPEIPELSVQSNLDFLRHWFRQATQTRTPDDRFGLVVFDGRAVAISTPTRGEYSDDQIDLTILEGTNIADAIELGLALFPGDAAKRLVLVSDGNETTGSALDAATRAAGSAGVELQSLDVSTFSGVPIDVLPIAYSVDQDVQVVQIDLPPTARPGQVVTARIVLESIRETDGYLALFREDAPIDLNGGEPGLRRALRLPAGRSVHTVQIEMATTPVNRFEAVFEPADDASDQLRENNVAETFVATPSRGSVLIVRSDTRRGIGSLEATLRANEIPVVVENPGRIPTDLLRLQAYDLVVIDNVPAYEIDESVQQLLARYVNDFGGGLLMTGGDRAFGAGGWNGTPVEDVLPLELDLPRELRLTQAALVLVLDKSGSMGMRVAGTRATQQEIANHGAAAAIESLQPDSLVGVVAFDSFPQVRVPLGPNDDPIESVRRVMGIMHGGGTYMVPALRKAKEMLDAANVERKYVVLLSDGRSDGREEIVSIAREMVADGIEISTIAVGDAADHSLLEQVSTIGGGLFYPVMNPATLPRFLVDSVQVVNKPLLKEVPFVPVVQPTGSTLSAGLSGAPMLGGIVLTDHRDDPRVVTELITPDGEPVLAHWQAGLGRAAAFTSALDGPWAARWQTWASAGAFWTQLVRLISRPPMNLDYELTTSIADGRLTIALEAVGIDEGFMDYLVVDGTVYSPTGEAAPVRLPQTGPGLYETTIDARESGNYIVALTPKRGERALAPVIGGVNQPGGAEYRRYRSNVALLREVSERTGGRVLDLADPSRVDLYDRATLPKSVSVLPAWRTFLWWLVFITLLDVAARRIAWDRNSIVQAWATLAVFLRLTQREETPQSATIAALRGRSESFDQTLERESAGVEKLKGDSRLRVPDRRRRAKDAGERKKEIREALAKLSGDSKPSVQPKKHQPDADAAAEPEADDQPDGSTTSGLLAAKRRLRREMNSDSSDNQ